MGKEAACPNGKQTIPRYAGDYADWVQEITEMHNKGNSWRALGEWLLARKSNTLYSQVVFHMCNENFMEDIDVDPPMTLEKCETCGKKTPDGIKMIALLEEL